MEKLEKVANLQKALQVDLGLKGFLIFKNISWATVHD